MRLISAVAATVVLAASHPLGALATPLNAPHRRDMEMDMPEMAEDHQEIASETVSSLDAAANGPLPSLQPTPHVETHVHGMPILETNLRPEERLFWESFDSTTFFSAERRPAAIRIHTGLLLASVFFVYPVTMVLKNVKSKLYRPLLALHTLLVVLALFNYSLFASSAEELYPNAAYGKMCWILLFSTPLQLLLSLFYTPRQQKSPKDYSFISDYDDNDDVETARSSSTAHRDGRGLQPESLELDEHEGARFATLAAAMLSPMPHSWYGRFSVPFSASGISMALTLLNWGHFFFFLVLIPTGIATFLRIGMGPHVFNVLAHFIKGGVFFSLGLLSLARYCGGLANNGWAWNHRFLRFDEILSRIARYQSRGLWTMEMVELSLILFYGCTNIFLEHLSSSGGAWSAKDLQHVTIAFIFIGCGLCGVLTEVKLADWRFERAIANYKSFDTNTNDDAIVKASPGFSPNPFPILTIYWTGYLMSKHTQASHLSTAIHTQWGNLFVMACVFRLLTYIMLLVTKASTLASDLTRPLRPMTELLTSFSLICGGMIFMESTDPIVYIFEYYGFTEMFTLNVSVGFTALIMAWQMLLFAMRDSLQNKA